MDSTAARTGRPAAETVVEAAAPPPPAGQWTLAWRRLRRDRVGMVALVLTILILLAIFVGAPVASRMLGHGPNDLFPYAVDVNARPASPWTHVPDLNQAVQSGDYE